MDTLRISGKTEFFDYKPWKEAADILVGADDPMRALQLLELVPGFERDHYPKELAEVKRNIFSKLATPTFYMSNPGDMNVTTENADQYVKGNLRGILIEQDVKEYNDKGIVPHLVDLGPGEYWLPIGLKALGHKFTYEDIGLCDKARNRALEILGTTYQDTDANHKPEATIYVACEILEHLHCEQDIAVECMRRNINPDIIHISTPRYSFDVRMTRKDWLEHGDLGHLRTYTPAEFVTVVTKMFAGYKWLMHNQPIMHLRGTKECLQAQPTQSLV